MIIIINIRIMNETMWLIIIITFIVTLFYKLTKYWTVSRMLLREYGEQGSNAIHLESGTSTLWKMAPSAIQDGGLNS